eukprot:6503814-Alexandrium_andersonii.AAC.1
MAPRIAEALEATSEEGVRQHSAHVRAAEGLDIEGLRVAALAARSAAEKLEKADDRERKKEFAA